MIFVKKHGGAPRAEKPHVLTLDGRSALRPSPPFRALMLRSQARHSFRKRLRLLETLLEFRKILRRRNSDPKHLNVGVSRGLRSDQACPA